MAACTTPTQLVAGAKTMKIRVVSNRFKTLKLSPQRLEYPKTSDGRLLPFHCQISRQGVYSLTPARLNFLAIQPQRGHADQASQTSICHCLRKSYPILKIELYFARLIAIAQHKRPSRVAQNSPQISRFRLKEASKTGFWMEIPQPVRLHN